MTEKTISLRCGDCGSELQFANVQLVPFTESQLMGMGVHVEIKCPCGKARLTISCPLRNTSSLPSKIEAKLLWSRGQRFGCTGSLPSKIEANLGAGTYTIQIQE